MRLGVLFSGGKDSTYALFKAMEKEQVVCLISLLSENEASYMFHTPNISLTTLQAQAIGLPLLQQITEGKKEAELGDLENVIKRAKEEFQIEGIVTGAVESVYQAERVQKICNTLNLWCFNPLWLKNQVEILEEIVTLGFWVIISGVFAYPFDETWLGIGSKIPLITVCNCCSCCCLWRMLPYLDKSLSSTVKKMPGVKIIVNENCNGCGDCTRNICFINNIKIKDGVAEIGKSCLACGRCIEICPNDAIELIIEDKDFINKTIERVSRAIS